MGLGPTPQLLDTVATGCGRGHRRPATHRTTPGQGVQGALRAPPHISEAEIQSDASSGAGPDNDSAVGAAPASGTDGAGAPVAAAAAAAHAGRPGRADDSGDSPPPEAAAQRSMSVIDQRHLHGNPSNQAGVSVGWYLPVEPALVILGLNGLPYSTASPALPAGRRAHELRPTIGQHRPTTNRPVLEIQMMGRMRENELS